MKIFNIIKGFWKWVTKENDSLAKERMIACNDCEKNVPYSIPPIANARICGVCHCFLKAKTREQSETCPHPDGSKWKR